MWIEQRQRTITALQTFLDMSLDAILERDTNPQAVALALFQTVAASVPAYQSFLSEQGIDPAAVRSFADFQALPLTTKENYLRRHALADLCRDGRLESCDMVAVSSGSTGQPTFWPRFLADEFQIAPRFEQVFHDSFGADSRRTLAVVCFALGTWVGGMYTASCCRHLAAKGYPITVISPGNNKEEIFRVVAELGQSFEQVVLLGYPPFLKDIIDSGIARGVEWRRYNIKLVMAGEVFSEEWRGLVGERMGSQNPCYDSASLYGTADAGVLANETPLSIRIRRFLAERPDVIRYHIADTGGLLMYDAMLRFLAEWGFDPVAALGGEGARGIRELPFVYVFGRSHFTISYFGANIYPENVTIGLEQPVIKEWVTGKFVLESKEDADRNRFLSVVVELAPEVAGGAERERAIAESILAQLRRLNSEFANYVPPEYQLPRVTLAPAGDPEWFPIGVKHRYTRKS